MSYENTVNDTIDIVENIVESSSNIKEVLVASNIFQQFKDSKSKAPLYSSIDSLQHTTKRNAVCCIIDFSEELTHEATTNLTFEDLRNRTHYEDEPLTTLNLANAILEDGGQLTIVCTGPYHESNEAIVKKYLLCTKFTDIQFNRNIILARKREFVKYSFDGGKITFEETTSPELIRNIHYFAKELFKDYNFDIDIDNIFTPYSDFSVCYKTDTKEIISFLRYTWHLPRHFLPCMLATKVDDGLHIALERPDENSYAEVFSPYMNSVSALKAYKELVKNFLRHYLSVGIKYVFTSFERSEPKSGDFYTRFFGFENTGITLRYGTFGGEWGLLKGGASKVGGNWRFKKEFLDNWLSHQSGMTKEKGSVLVVDDDPIVRELLEEVVSEHGHHVKAVESGEKALAELSRQHYSLVFLDLVMPGTSGLEVLKAIKGQFKKTAVAIVTGYGDDPIALEAMAEGPLLLIRKPFKIEDVVQVLYMLVRAGS